MITTKLPKILNYYNKVENIDELEEVCKCSTANCAKFYHLSCIKKEKLVKFID